MPEFVRSDAAECNAAYAKSTPWLDRDAGGARADSLNARFEQVVSSDGAPDLEAKVACGSRLPSGVVAGTVPSRNWPVSWILRKGREVTVRPIVEADAAEIVQSFERLSEVSRYYRFMGRKKSLDSATVQRGVHPRPGLDFVLVATIPAADGIDIVGAGQYVPAVEGKAKTCEFAITVAEDWRRIGLATRLLACLVQRARRDGYETMEGWLIAQNRPMLAVARKLHFKIEHVPEDATVLRAQRAL